MSFAWCMILSGVCNVNKIISQKANKNNEKSKNFSIHQKGVGMDREKAIRNITRFLNKATDAELRAICMAAYHITKRS